MAEVVGAARSHGHSCCRLRTSTPPFAIATGLPVASSTSWRARVTSTTSGPGVVASVLPVGTSVTDVTLAGPDGSLDPAVGSGGPVIASVSPDTDEVGGLARGRADRLLVAGTAVAQSFGFFVSTYRASSSRVAAPWRTCRTAWRRWWRAVNPGSVPGWCCQGEAYECRSLRHLSWTNPEASAHLAAPCYL